MIAQLTVKYFKRDIWFLDDAKNAKPKNQEIEFTIINGKHVQLIERTDDSILICDFCPCENSIHSVMCNELHYLAKNQPGIFRLIFMCLDTNTYFYQISTNLAKIHNISL